MKTIASKKTSKPTASHPCNCGCGEMAKGNYRPGHDARHAGVVGRKMADPGVTPATRNELLATLGSDALRMKAIRVMENAQTKAQAKEARRFLTGKPTKAKAPKAVTAKVGRWVREGRIEGTEFVYTDKSGTEKRASKFEVVR